MAKHRKAATNHVNPLLGGALVAGALLAAAPAGLAFADTTGVNGRPDTPHDQPGVNAIQTAGDKVFDNPNATIPGFLGGGPISLNGTDAGQLYHALYGNSDATLQTDDDGNPVDPSQGLTVGVVNSFTTNYKVRCNIVVQTRCGSFS